MLTGRSDLPAGLQPERAAADRLAVDRRRRRGDGPAAEQPAAGRRPARAAGPQHRPGHPRPVRRRRWGRSRDPWFIEASPFDPTAYGAFPEYEFDHQERPTTPQRTRFQVPDLTLPEGLAGTRAREPARACSTTSTASGATWTGAAGVGRFDAHRQAAVSLLTDAQVRRAFDVGGRRPEGARPLRPQRLRLVAADGPPAGRGGRQPGAGEPRQQRDLGHARQRLPAPEGQALAADRPGGLGAARRPARAAACSTRR